MVASVSVLSPMAPFSKRYNPEGRFVEQSSRPVDEDLLGGFGLMGFVGSFDELAVDEHRAGADEGDEMRCVDRASGPARPR